MHGAHDDGFEAVALQRDPQATGGLALHGQHEAAVALAQQGLGHGWRPGADLQFGGDATLGEIVHANPPSEEGPSMAPAAAAALS